MKIKYIPDETLSEDTIVVNFHPANPKLAQLQAHLAQQTEPAKLTVLSQEREILLNPDEILFFETSGEIVYVHTANKSYQIKLRLYEIEQLQYAYFCRISKSTIVNLKQIYALEKGFGADSLIRFRQSHKEVYVSRLYYKLLKEKIKEKITYEKK